MVPPFWEFAAAHLIDHERGGWYPMLDEHNVRKSHPWYGKPDIYHSLQACLLPDPSGRLQRRAGAIRQRNAEDSARGAGP